MTRRRRKHGPHTGLKESGFTPEDIGAFAMVRVIEAPSKVVRGRGQPKGSGIKTARGPALWAYMRFLISEFDQEPLEAARQLMRNGFTQVLAIDSATPKRAWSVGRVHPYLLRRVGELPSPDDRIRKSFALELTLRTDYYRLDSQYYKDQEFRAACDRKLENLRNAFAP